MSEIARVRRDIRFWDGAAPRYDVSILMTAYRAEATIEDALRSIFAQKVEPDVCAQLIIGVDPARDGTLDVARRVCAEAPDWLTVDIFENELPNLVIGGRRTARSNFMNAYARICGAAVAYLNCDDAWLTTGKLQAQLSHFRATGEASCTALETERVALKKRNDSPVMLSPFEHGTTVLFSSFMMPYVDLGRSRIWWVAGFLDLPIICYCYERFGVSRLLDQKTFYRVHESSSWSGLSRATMSRNIRRTVLLMAVFGPYRLSNRIKLLRWGRRQ